MDSEELREEAVALVEAFEACASEENRTALTSWRSRSPRHERAALAAERYLAGLQVVERRHPVASRKLAIRAQAWLERATSTPVAPVVGAGVVAVLCLALLPGLRSTPESVDLEPEAAHSELWTDAFVSGRGRQRHERLPDGSELWLDWSSSVTLRFTDSLREVELLRGAVAFDVEPDRERHFVVRAGGATTRVTGTEFVVRRRDERVDVAVLEGSVLVSGEVGVPIALAPEQALAVLDGVPSVVVVRTLPEIGAWRDGVLVFRNRPLLEALELLAGYASVRLDTSRLRPDLDTVTGTFFVDQADEALTSVFEAHALDARDDEPGHLVLSHRPFARP